MATGDLMPLLPPVPVGNGPGHGRNACRFAPIHPVPTCADCEEDTVATHTHSTFCSHPGALSWPGRHTDGASGSMPGRGIPASVPVCRKPVAIRRILPMHIRCTIVRRQRSRPPDALDILRAVACPVDRFRAGEVARVMVVSVGALTIPCDAVADTRPVMHPTAATRVASTGVWESSMAGVCPLSCALAIHRFVTARDGSGAHALSGKETVRRRGPLPFGVHAPDDRAATRECVDTTRRAWHHW